MYVYVCSGCGHEASQTRTNDPYIPQGEGVCEGHTCRAVEHHIAVFAQFRKIPLAKAKVLLGEIPRESGELAGEVRLRLAHDAEQAVCCVLCAWLCLSEERGVCMRACVRVRVFGWGGVL